MSLLQVKNLTVKYRDRMILDRVSLSMDQGDRIALVGPNGAGKTTLLGALVGLVPFQAGEIKWRDRLCDSEENWVRLRHEMTFLFQDPDDQLFCPTVLEDVAFGPCNLGLSEEESEQRARRVLAELGMESYSERMSHILSGGEKRMVALACVLAMEPKILLLDEPFAGLDEDASKRVSEVLKGIQCGVLMVSHNRKAIEIMSPVVWSLSKGVLDTSDLFQSI